MHYATVMIISVTDIESFEGTCYKASGWEALGKTRGYSRHRADFYVRHDRPKKLWVKPLRKTACAILCGPVLAEPYQGGAKSSAHGVMPLKAKQMMSLHEHLCAICDPRAGNRIFHIGAILAIVAMALLSGYRDIAQIHRFGQRLTQAQRKALGLPRKPDKAFYRVPGYKTYYHLLGKLDPNVLASHLSEWLRAHQGQLPASLAMDGKMIRRTVGTVCLVKQIPDLSGRTTTADALHCQVETAQEIVSRGGDFILQVKDNQKTVHKLAQAGMTGFPPFLNGSRNNMTD